MVFFFLLLVLTFAEEEESPFWGSSLRARREEDLVGGAPGEAISSRVMHSLLRVWKKVVVVRLWSMGASSLPKLLSSLAPLYSSPPLFHGPKTLQQHAHSHLHLTPTKKDLLATATTAVAAAEAAAFLAALATQWAITKQSKYRPSRLAAAIAPAIHFRAKTRLLRLVAEILLAKRILQQLLRERTLRSSNRGLLEEILLDNEELEQSNQFFRARILRYVGVPAILLVFIFMTDRALMSTKWDGPPAAVFTLVFFQSVVSPTLNCLGSFVGINLDLNSMCSFMYGCSETICAWIIDAGRIMGTIIEGLAGLARQEKPLRAILDLLEFDAYVYDTASRILGSACSGLSVARLAGRDFLLLTVDIANALCILAEDLILFMADITISIFKKLHLPFTLAFNQLFKIAGNTWELIR